MEKIKVSQAVIVEGKYDQIRLSSMIDGLIITLDGFRIYKNREKLAMIRAVAKKCGLIILTDSDRAGFQLRGFLRSVAADAALTHIYIPQIQGKERRKTVSSKENLLGVEGMDLQVLRELFQKAGVLCEPQADEPKITRMNFYEDGLMGGANAAKKRQALIQFLHLPSYMTTNGLLEVINLLMTWEEYEQWSQNNQQP